MKHGLKIEKIVVQAVATRFKTDYSTDEQSSPMKKTLLTTLRDKNTNRADFRNAAEKITHLLAHESFHFLKEKKIKINTPLTKATGSRLTQDIVLIPILRSGMAFLPVFLSYFPNAKVGFMGLKRDEKTAIAHEYYQNIPKISKHAVVIVLDPMIATGGSAVDTLKALAKLGVKQAQIIFIGLIAAEEGLRRVRKHFPGVKIVIGVVDKKLNSKKFIVPGLGDFGDRYFGTES